MAMPKKITKQAEEVKEELIDVKEEVKELNEDVVEEATETVKEKEEKVEEKTEDLKEKTEAVKEKITKKAKEVKESLEEKIEDIKEKAEEVKENIKEKAEEITEDVKEEAEEVKEKVEDKKEEIVEEVKENEEKIPQRIKRLIKSRRPLMGKVKTTNSDDSTITLEVEGLDDVCMVKFDEFSNMDAKYLRADEIFDNAFHPYIAKEYKDGILWVSGKEAFLDFVSNLKDEPYTVTISKFLEYGALCRFKDYNIFGEIRNSNFINKPFIRVPDVFDVKDEVEVKITSVTNQGRVALELVNKDVEVKSKYAKEDLKPGVALIGVVKSIHPFGCFVNLDAGLDGICSIPPYLSNQIHKGVKVIYKITSVDKEDGNLRIRGKILGDVD